MATDAAAEVRRRVAERRGALRRPRGALLEAGKRQLADRVLRRTLERRFGEAVQEFDGVTQLCVTERELEQSLVLRRSEQEWDIAKQLRSAQTSVRRHAEGKKRSSSELDTLEQKLMDMRELATAGIGDEGEEADGLGDGSQQLAQAQIRRGQGRAQIFADLQVDAELARLQGKLENTAVCPHCQGAFLRSAIEGHVRVCRDEENSKIPLAQHTEAALDAKSQRYVELERNARRKAAQQLRAALENRRKSFVATVEVCPECGKQVLASRIARHLAKCQEQQRLFLQSRRQREEEAIKASGLDGSKLDRILPLPPDNLRLVSLSADSFELEWSPPVFMGGFDVYVHDYIIEYATCSRHRNGKSVTQTITPQPPLSTSRFCMVNPLCGRTFVVTGLSANTEYVNICVRAKNEVGLSEPSNMIQSVVTDDLAPPGPPQHFMVARVTASSVVFAWSAPCKTGGAPRGIHHYEITYSRYIFKGIKMGKVLCTETAHVAAPTLCFALTELECSSTVSRISVVAVTEGFVNGDKRVLRSEPTPEIDRVTTLEPSREELIRLEIRRVSQVDMDTVDSRVYAGFSQRYARQDLLLRLTQDLGRIEKRRKTMARVEAEMNRAEDEESKQAEAAADSHEPASAPAGHRHHRKRDSISVGEEEKRRRRKAAKAARKRATIKLSNRASDASKPSVMEAVPMRLLVEAFGYQEREVLWQERQQNLRQKRDAARPTLIEANAAMETGSVPRRRKQFKHRIGILRKRIEDLENRRGELVMRRAMLTKELAATEQRITALLAEHDRVAAHGAEFIDSSVMHDRVQRFLTRSLQAALEVELRSAKAKIAAGKREQVAINRELKTREADMERASMHLKDREARLVAFEKEVTKKTKAIERVRNWRLKIVMDMFLRWSAFVESQREVRKSARHIVQHMLSRDQSRAWHQWCAFVAWDRARETNHKDIEGLGSFMLAHVEDGRNEVKASVAEALHRVRNTSHELEQAKKTRAQQQALRESPLYKPDAEAQMAFERAHAELFALSTLTLRQASAYLSQGRNELALRYFEAHAQRLSEQGKAAATAAASGRSGPMIPFGGEGQKPEETEEAQQARELREMCESYYGMALALQRLGRIDKAIVTFDRTRSLAVEAGSEPMKGAALLGIAECNTLNGLYKSAIEYADRALLVFEDLDDALHRAKAMRALEHAYAGVFDEERRDQFAEMARKLEQGMAEQIRASFARIEAAERKMISITADRSTEIRLEVVSAKVPGLRARIEEKRHLAEEIIKQSKHFQRASEIDSGRLKVIEDQLNIVRKCKKEELDSDLVHGIMQRFKVPQLQVNLESEQARLTKAIETYAREKEKADIRASNAKDDMRGLEETLAVELGPLMRKVIMGHQRFRCCGLNPANVRSRDVTGLASGGVEKLICVMRDSVYLFDLRDGALLAILDGAKTRLDPLLEVKREKDPALPIPGHFGCITSAYYSENTIVTGGVDTMIRVWDDHGDYRCRMLLRGHEGTIWSLYADPEKIVSGSSDMSVRVWALRKKSGKCVRVIRNMHRRCVKCMDVDGKALATGSSDFQVRVWPCALDFSSRRVNPKADMKSFRGHDCPVTCVRLSADELISGGEDGRVLVWDVTRGSILYTCEGHTASVRSLQADATRIVTGSVDNTVGVFDAATGSCLLTLRGHEDQVLSVQFDQHRILSVSADGTMRQWHWSGDREERMPSYDKLHVLQAGETLAKLEELHGSSVRDIMLWNNIQDVGRTLYVGMRLIVKKGSLTQDKPADAAAVAGGAAPTKAASSSPKAADAAPATAAQ